MSNQLSSESTPINHQAGNANGVRVLVIDDEPEIQRAIRTRLSGAEYRVEGALTGEDGLRLVEHWQPNIVILDLSLPDMDGLEVCRQVRRWSQVPIIVLSVRMSDADKVTLLEAGADDYLTKPFSSSELVARVRVALRHASPAASAANSTIDATQAGTNLPLTPFQLGTLLINFQRRRVSVAGADIHLTPKEYDVLTYLAIHAGKVITHRTLLQAVWGPQYATEDHYLHVFIRALRRKIEPNPSRPRYLLTEPGVGYLLHTADDQL